LISAEEPVQSLVRFAATPKAWSMTVYMAPPWALAMLFMCSGRIVMEHSAESAVTDTMSMPRKRANGALYMSIMRSA